MNIHSQLKYHRFITEPYALHIDSLKEPTHLLYIERYIHYFIAEVQ